MLRCKTVQLTAPDSRGDPVHAAVAAELAGLDAEERFLWPPSSRPPTLAELGCCKHESTISRKLERISAGARKRPKG
jgi:hypothetical protein